MVDWLNSVEMSLEIESRFSLRAECGSDES